MPLARLQPGTWPATQARALTENQTADPSVRGMTPDPLSHTSQGQALCVLTIVMTPGTFRKITHRAWFAVIAFRCLFRWDCSRPKGTRYQGRRGRSPIPARSGQRQRRHGWHRHQLLVTQPEEHRQHWRPETGISSLFLIFNPHLRVCLERGRRGGRGEIETGRERKRERNID